MDGLKSQLTDLESERMRFELVRPEHLKDIATYLADDEIRSNMKLETLNTLEKQEAWFEYYRKCREKGEMVQWTGYLKSDQSYAALLTIKEISWKDQRAELGYSVSKPHWRKGLASEAAAHALNFAFKKLNLHTLYAQISPDNLASQRVVEKLGFRQEGHLKECFIYKDKFYDLLQYSIVNPWHKN